MRTENTLSLKFIFIGQMIQVTGTSCNLLTSFHNNVWVWLMSWYLPTVQYIHLTQNISVGQQMSSETKLTATQCLLPQEHNNERL